MSIRSVTCINIFFDMEDFFWIAVLRNIGLVIMAAYITVQLPAFRRALHNFPNRSRDKLFLIFVLGIFSAFGNLIGIPIEGAIANTRIVGPVVGGLLGGPVVGVGVGIIGAIPRYFMGGFTMWPSILSNILAGYISGLVGKTIWHSQDKFYPGNFGCFCLRGHFESINFNDGQTV